MRPSWTYPPSKPSNVRSNEEEVSTIGGVDQALSVELLNMFLVVADFLSFRRKSLA